MHSKKAKAPTKAERRRWTDLQLRVGCVACRQLPGAPYREPDMHHTLSGGRRVGHAATAPLCEWHHRGMSGVWRTQAHATEIYGPSLAHNPRLFRERFGTDAQLMALTEEWLRRTSCVAAGATPTG